MEIEFSDAAVQINGMKRFVLTQAHGLKDYQEVLEDRIDRSLKRRPSEQGELTCENDRPHLLFLVGGCRLITERYLQNSQAAGWTTYGTCETERDKEKRVQNEGETRITHYEL